MNNKLPGMIPGSVVDPNANKAPVQNPNPPKPIDFSDQYRNNLNPMGPKVEQHYNYDFGKQKPKYLWIILPIIFIVIAIILVILMFR